MNRYTDVGIIIVFTLWNSDGIYIWLNERTELYYLIRANNEILL